VCVINNMLGIINLAIRNLVLAKFGVEAWLKILATANLTSRAPSHLVSSQPPCDPKAGEWIRGEQYDDAETFALVAAAASALSVRPAVVLQLFGQFWIEQQNTDETFKKILQHAGTTFLTFLRNINNLHKQCADVVPCVQPIFDISNVNTEGTHATVTLTYKPSAKTRLGLAPLAVGLLEGAANRFPAVHNLKIYTRELDGLEAIEILVSWDELSPIENQQQETSFTDDALIQAFLCEQGFIPDTRQGGHPGCHPHRKSSPPTAAIGGQQQSSPSMTSSRGGSHIPTTPSMIIKGSASASGSGSFASSSVSSKPVRVNVQPALPVARHPSPRTTSIATANNGNKEALPAPSPSPAKSQILQPQKRPTSANNNSNNNAPVSKVCIVM